ncbi:DUF3472 domain-containing protein [Niabella drilacis]|uniref:Uncharacterized protein n=1 Tax=Niabella drilacis (strain DSM 25811 / CCM 8410 / CCUG 62505 / LMG 26954 / E90) TaxID=1285928 RepID=A0A1G6NK97_NIADE|nr:DUF3472 domain-containing protein [Niabella drilacis]SDC67727.1 protein of unknown function [Niabella drilacis]
MNRHRRILFSGCFLFSLSMLQAQSPGPAAEKKQFEVPANKAYAEPFTPGDPGVSIPVGYPESRGSISKWRNKDKSVSWIVYQKPGQYDLYFDNQVTAGKKLRFRLDISGTYPQSGLKQVSRDLVFTGTGKKDTLYGSPVRITSEGYYKYTLTPVTDPEGAITITTLLFKTATRDGWVNFINYQSTPSVHLSFSSTVPTTKSYNWLYEEILVPEGEDPLHTYYMSLGFYRGYLGIQTNSPTERRVLFSVWDSKDAEKDSSITKADFVSLVDKDPATTVKSFGGEGTGGQSFVKDANWKTGRPVRFLMNVLPQENNSVVLSAWYQVANEGWQYIASWRAPREKRFFDGFYSFLENYGYTNGQLRREAYYYNAWGVEQATGKWINFNKVRFSNTDGKTGQRVDYEQGVSLKYPDRFYMAAGGYTPTVKTKNEMPVLKTPPSLDLKKFEARVTEALKNEGRQNIRR